MVALHTRNDKLLVVVAFAAITLLIVAGPVAPPTTQAPTRIAESPGTPTPMPVATPTPSPSFSPTIVTEDDVTVDGPTIVGPLSSSDDHAIGIKAEGTASAPIRNLTIRNCTIKGFNTAIEVRHVINFVIEDCLIEDAGYGGIMVFSGIGGRISGNTIRRIGYGIDTTDGNNAYGIALSRSGVEDLGSQPRSSDIVVDGNLVEDVPLWHGLDTHAGRRITFSNNVVRRSARPIFITGDGAGYRPVDITVTGNRLEEAVEVRGGTNMRAITLVNVEGGAITDNAISSTYPTPHVYDYLASDSDGSTGLTISGQTVIP